ncbi:MAG: efflux RND transporter periplasmic adaptor subunit [Acidobacteriota bacterium]|nr:efflux RND transporter periplasmic adaptor subunit [Acidobacteriota bacterium]
MKRRRILLVVLLLAAIGGSAYYLLSGPPRTLRLTGIVDGNEVVVSAKITGRIERMKVRDGDRVTAGEVVAVLDHREQAAAVDAASAAAAQAQQVALQAADQVALTRASIAARIAQAQAQVQQAAAQEAQARATLDQAESNYKRTLPLYAEGLVTAQDRDNAKASRDGAEAGVQVAVRALAAARAALADARAQQRQIAVQERQVEAYRAAAAQAQAAHQEQVAMLDQSEIVAPISGVVTLRAAREGEVVKPGDPIITIFELSDTWVQADVEETYADLVRLGETVTVQLPSGAEVQGPIIYKAVEAGFATQRDVSRTKRDIKTVAIRVRVDNADERLARGMTAWVVLPLRPKGKA